MEEGTLRRVVDLAGEVGRAIVATASVEGMPHVAVARKLTLGKGNTVVATEWFCPGTVANLMETRLVSIVVWDDGKDVGYQILGSLERMEDVAMLDGYRGSGGEPPVPQVQRALRVKVEKVLRFTEAPHSDREE